MDMRLTKAFVLCSVTALTAACNDTTTEPTVVTGQLNVPVSGLSYKTDSLSGTTDETGSFEYREGENITFSLGQYTLLSVVADAQVTLASLVGEERFQAAPTVKLLKAIIALDDNDVYNGLTVDASSLSETSSTFAAISDSDYANITNGLGDAKVYAYLKWMNFDNSITMSAGNHHTLGLTESGKPFSFGENYAGVMYAESPSRYCGSELRLKLGRASDDDLEPGTELDEEGNDTLTDEENACYIEGNIARQYGLYNANSGWMTLTDESLIVNSVSTDQVDGALVTDDGRLFVFGPNYSGELGTGNESPVTTPVEVILPNNELAVYATSGSASSYAVTRSGKVYSAGDNGNLQLGRSEDASDDQNTFGLVLIPENEVIVDIAIRDHHVYALTEKGDVYSWGNNSSNGELGDSSVSVDRSTPLKVLEGKDIIAIEAGADFGLAVNNAGTVYGWGYNGYGALAQGTPVLGSSIYKITDIENILIPEVIVNLSTGSEAMGSDRIIAFQGGSRNAQALSLNGDVYSWGDMGTGYFGNGYEVDESGVERQISIQPVKVATLDDPFVVSLSANTSSHFAVTDDNVVYAWGSTSDGRLGVSQDTCAEDATSLYGDEALTSVCYTPIAVTVTPNL
jgi:alpha-tubulin suppressor-like RCC1 family protein